MIKTILSTAARQSFPHARNAPIGPGKVQGELATTLLTNPIVVANQAIRPFHIGAIIKGIINIGFNTIGAPKIIGSFILKIAGTIAVLPNALP